MAIAAPSLTLWILVYASGNRKRKSKTLPIGSIYAGIDDGSRQFSRYISLDHCNLQESIRFECAKKYAMVFKAN